MSNGNGTMNDAETELGGEDALQEVMHHFLEAATVDAVYGEPVQSGETVVVPAAEVVSIFGYGMGYGSGGAPANGEAGDAGGSGQGGGGGGAGRVLSRPVAAIIINGGSVRVEPIVDVTKLGLAALTAVGFMFMTMLRMGSRRSALPGPEDD